MAQHRVQPSENRNDDPPLSVCDVMRDNTNEVIVKFESLLPSYIENLSDMQAEYLRIARDLFGTCYIAEKELFDKIGIDQKAIESFDRYLKVVTKSTTSQIDIVNNMQKMFFSNAMSAMKSYDDYVKLMLDAYSKMLTNTSALIPKKN